VTHPNANNHSAHGFTERVNRAFLVWQAGQGRRVTQTEIGKLVGKVLQSGAVNPATVSRWFQGAEPPLATIAAMAKVFECDPGWLAFGEGKPPEDPVTKRVRPL
jgi:transcriptional regulator with XRE-family HTH domain